MTNLLTPDEQAFLKKIEEQRLKHNISQKKYNEKNKEKKKDYNKSYQNKIRTEKEKIMKKIVQPPPVEVNLDEIKQTATQKPKYNRRTKKQVSNDIKPKFLTRDIALGYSTIEDYIRKADIIQRFFINKSLSQALKGELRKLLNNNPNIDEKMLLGEMPYFTDIDNTIKKLRDKYKNDNTFKSYINVLVVITSHISSLNKTYQILTRLNINVNNTVQERRDKNDLTDDNKDKIIDLNKDVVLKNLDKLTDLQDRLIYGLYCLFPARRLDYANMKLTKVTDPNNLNDNSNYLIDGKTYFEFVFNNYKTKTKYGQQVFKIENEKLKSIIQVYIDFYKLDEGDYLFHLDRSKKEPILQPNFSVKISNTFKKVYGIPISIRYLRMSWATDIFERNPTNDEFKELSYKMSHSLSEQAKYKKIKNKK